MRLPDSAHSAQPWRIHEMTSDFRVEDVWALPGSSGLEDIRRVVELLVSNDASHRLPFAVRALVAIRWKLGELVGWDRPDAGVGSRVPSLRARLPQDLLAAPSGPELPPFTSLYLLDDEWAAEVANRTMHGVLHVGRVPVGGGRYRVQMATLVKPNGLAGHAYMAAIRPFRRLLVYPALLRHVERTWQTGTHPLPSR